MSTHGVLHLRVPLIGMHLAILGAISMIHTLISQSPDIQKILAFEGAFEKLFNIVSQEGGIEGDTIAQDALRCVDSLLRFNMSNQVRNYLRPLLKGLAEYLVLRAISVTLRSPPPYVRYCSFPSSYLCKTLLLRHSLCSSGTIRSTPMRHGFLVSWEH